MTPQKSLENWILEAMELALDERITFEQAAARLGRDEPPEALAAIKRRKSYKDVLNSMTRAYFAARGGASDTDKTVLVGSILDDARHLRLQGRAKEASDATEKAAKILGLIGSETTVNLLADVHGSELQRAIALVRAQRATAIN